MICNSHKSHFQIDKMFLIGGSVFPLCRLQSTVHQLSTYQRRIWAIYPANQQARPYLIWPSSVSKYSKTESNGWGSPLSIACCSGFGPSITAKRKHILSHMYKSIINSKCFRIQPA